MRRARGLSTAPGGGADLIERAGANVVEIAPWARPHQKRWDGSGNADALRSEEEIPFEASARMIATDEGSARADAVHDGQTSAATLGWTGLNATAPDQA